MAAPAYKLVYFAARGRAEALRLAFAYGGIEFVDERNAGPALMAKRAAGDVKPPFGQFPIVEVNGVPLGQSATILRLISKKAGLYPADELVAAQAESVVDQLNDIAGASYPAVFGPDAAAKEAALAALLGPEGKIAKMMAGIVAYAGDKDFLFGDKASLADIMLYAIIEGFSGFGIDMLASAPALKKVYTNVGALPQLAAYFAKRAEIEAAEKAAAQ